MPQDRMHEFDVEETAEFLVPQNMNIAEATRIVPQGRSRTRVAEIQVPQIKDKIAEALQTAPRYRIHETDMEQTVDQCHVSGNITLQPSPKQSVSGTRGHGIDAEYQRGMELFAGAQLGALAPRAPREKGCQVHLAKAKLSWRQRPRLATCPFSWMRGNVVTVVATLATHSFPLFSVSKSARVRCDTLDASAHQTASNNNNGFRAER